ncbi:hypothetical protein ACIQNU_13895 [Streptomyces sp. NPDC091292]|uniref:hypothetical protein n=1 Tax=Streptomyces sp. NPDC091292 TaxID=3365991 RepID=UPI0037FFAF6D
MSPRHPVRARRKATVTALLLASCGGAVLTGCGDSGGLEAAGATPTAVGPARLWPDLTPASTPAYDYDEAHTETIKGLTAPGDDIRKLDPLTVLRTQAKEHPDTFTGDDALDADTARKITECGDEDGGEDAAGSGNCPVLRAYYRDLTGDGRDDLVIGIRMHDGQLAVRVYAFEQHTLTQIMGTSDAVIGVEVAGRDLVIRAVSGIAGYEYRTVWAWDRHQHAMLPTKDEILRVGGSSTKPVRPRVTPPPLTTPTPSPSATPNASQSAP